MKNKFTTFILFLLMMVLLGIIGFFGFLIYSDLTGNDATEIIGTIGETISTEIIGEDKNENTNSNLEVPDIIETTNDEEQPSSGEISNSRFFYNQLTETQKAIYDGLQQNKEEMQTGTYVIDYGDKFSDILAQDGGNDRLKYDYQTAIESYTHDNMDVFYLDVTKLYLNIETTKKTFKTTYRVYIAPPSGSTYLKEEFSTQEDVVTALAQIESVKNQVLKNLTGNTYKDIIEIHDYLVDNIEYDKTYEVIGSYSIYGALVTETCVCEGYSKAFKYLANAAGISCELMQGTAKNSNDEIERHAWNAVYLNESWYYIDATWDDPIIIGTGIISPGTRYKYFLKGSYSFTKDHFMESELSTGGKKYTYPTMSDSDYK